MLSAVVIVESEQDECNEGGLSNATLSTTVSGASDNPIYLLLYHHDDIYK
jgi:hypothetical protein